MKRVLVLFSATVLFSGCASTFIIKDADKIPEDQRVKVVINRNIVIRKIDGEWAPATMRGPGSSEELTYFLTPGVHTLVVECLTMDDDRGVAIVFSSGKDPEFKTDNREDPFELSHEFTAGKTYIISYEFPDDYSIRYFIHER